jgi:pyruvate oxidase
MDVASFILDQLGLWGVRHLYGVIGDAVLPFMDAVAKQEKMRFIPVRHESAAGFMAAAEAKLTGRMAVCIGTSGPGFANLINGLGDAYADRVPLLVLTGQVETYKIGTDVKQYVDQQAVVRAMAGYSTLLAGPGGIGSVLREALKTAIGEGRVAQISVPKDLWRAPVDLSLHPPEPYLTAPPVPSGGVLAEAAALLRSAKRPLILAGHGARPAAGALLALAKAWGAGIVLALGGKGIVPGHEPRVLGGVGTGGSEAAHQALQLTDLLLVIGSTWWPSGYIPKQVHLVQVDTQPHHVGGKHPAAFGLVGDSAMVVPALVEELHRDSGADRSDWTGMLLRLKGDWEKRLAQEGANTTEGPIHPAQVVRALEGAAPPGSIITLDTGDHLLWFNRHFYGTEHWVLFSGRWRTMGYALPAASAAKLCRPETPVIALVGDGGLTMLLGELSVPVELGLRLTVLVSRNGSLALEENKARSEGYAPFGHVLQNPDFAAVARAFGWKAWRVESETDLQEALRQAAETEGPCLLDIWTANDPSLHSGPA